LNAGADRRPGGRPVVIVAGPTGSGKSELAAALARAVGGEVISADSRQIYRGLSAATAAPAGEWRETPEGPRYISEGVVHHLVGSVDPATFYSAGRFAREAAGILQDLARRNVPAVVAGGTGLYLRALTRGLADLPERDPALRRSLAEEARERGRPYLHGRLAALDPAAAREIPANNLQRVIRAMEIRLLTGVPISDARKRAGAPAWDFRWFGLRWAPEAYERRIAVRCRAMAPGLLAEVKALLDGGFPPTAPGLEAIGAREASDHLEGRTTRVAFEAALSLRTRRYAKRQRTWLRGETDVRWLDMAEPFDAEETANRVLRLLDAP
jgi:tRNA dimethylallyltransferase